MCFRLACPHTPVGFEGIVTKSFALIERDFESPRVVVTQEINQVSLSENASKFHSDSCLVGGAFSKVRAEWCLSDSHCDEVTGSILPSILYFGRALNRRVLALEIF